MDYADRPWLARYLPGMPTDIEIPFESALAMFDATVERAGDRPLIDYFGRVLSVAEVDRASDALSVALVAAGCQRGDRVAIDLQNVPQFVISLLAAWKAGCIVVSINPMNKERELDLPAGGLRRGRADHPAVAVSTTWRPRWCRAARSAR